MNNVGNLKPGKLDTALTGRASSHTFYVLAENDALNPWGPHHTVRGYRENRQVTDQGFFASLEFRFPLWTSEDGHNSIQIAPFFDYAAVRNRSRPTPGPRTLPSSGNAGPESVRGAR